MGEEENMAALECVFNLQTKTYFVVDILHWGETQYKQFPLAVRQHYLIEKFKAIVDSGIDKKYNVKFKLVDYLPCSLQSFNACHYGPLLFPYLI